MATPKHTDRRQARDVPSIQLADAQSLIARVEACAALMRVAEVAVSEKWARNPVSSKLERAVEDIGQARVALHGVASELRVLITPPTPGVLNRLLAASDIGNLHEAASQQKRPGPTAENGTRLFRGPDIIPAKRGRPRK